MEKEYKIFVINSLYGLIDGSSSSLQSHMTSYFKERFGFSADDITVTHTNRITSEYRGSWIGSMTVTLTISGEKFTHTRDWGVEYDIDIKHPEYETDDWFYEGEECEAYRKAQEAYKQIEEGVI